MKRLVILVPTLFIALLTATIISAAGIEITLEQDNEFYQGELLQAEIVGAFLEDLELTNIAIYEGESVGSAPLANSNLYKSGNKYLYYAVLPHTLGNFSIRVKDVRYYVGQDVSEETVALNFTITETLDPYISINKGFILATDEFDITVTSFNGIQEVTVDFPEGEEITKEIGYNQKKKFSFNIEEGLEEYTESTIDVEGIEIPLFITPITPPPKPFIDGTEQDFIEDNDSEVPAPAEVTLEEATTAQIQTCADLEGQICKKSQTCEGPTTFASGVVCCTGECTDKPESTGWIWGLGLLLILGGVLYWYYYKSKKEGKPTTPKKELEERTQRFKERTHPAPTPPKEVRSSLSRQ